MNLYLVQHGLALSEDVDPRRPLSDQGRDDVERVARFVARAGARVATIVHSEKERARQTAELFAAALGDPPVVERAGLAPNDDPATLAAELRAMAHDAMFVGHLPFMNRLASLLLADRTDPPVVEFHQGAVVCLHRAGAAWTVAWMIVPRLLSHAVGS